MKTKFAKTEITEQSYAAPERIDRDAGVIHGVKILGPTSINRREYTRAALEQAAAKYVNTRVNIDHPEKAKVRAPRGTLEQWGWLENIQVRDEGVYGDLHYIKSHPHTEPLLELAERKPGNFGLSHNAECGGYTEGGKQIVESVEQVRSVDVVQRPATTQGLFEHVEDEEPAIMKKTLKESIKAILESAPEGTRGRRGLQSLLEMDGMADMMATTVEVPSEGTESASPEEQVWEGFRSAVISVLDDPSMDVATTAKKIGEILKNYDKSFGAAPAETPSETPAEETATTEGVDELRKEVAALRNENKARAILEGADVAFTPTRAKQVIAVMESETDLTAALADFPKRAGKATAGGQAAEQRTPAKKPVRSVPLTESDEGNNGGHKSALPYKDRKELAKLIR